ncbi:hypothetical protein OPQ81_009045 [Rhizoctonia solani]|nr:hypothetical protein OPQ81_009045 [Rhizoctonia solani]
MAPWPQTPTEHPPEPFPERSKAMAAAWADRSHIQVFTDAVVNQTGVAAAAVLCTDGGLELRVGVRLGGPSSLSSLDTEIAGILLAAHLVTRIQADTIVDDVTIYTDSQTAISCINNHTKGASRQLLKATRKEIRLARRNSGGMTIHLKWCPGHEGVPGNEAADEEAARAAAGATYPPHLIPPFLADYRPALNPTTRKQAIKAENRRLTNTHWSASAAGIKHSTRYPNLSPRHFLGHARNLSRARATLLLRLTTGHVQLRQHLHRLQLTDSPDCEHCNKAESVEHFLTECTRYAEQRQEHLAPLGTDSRRPAFLLHAAAALEPLFGFIRATGRFADLVR